MGHDHNHTRAAHTHTHTHIHTHTDTQTHPSTRSNTCSHVKGHPQLLWLMGRCALSLCISWQLRLSGRVAMLPTKYVESALKTHMQLGLLTLHLHIITSCCSTLTYIAYIDTAKAVLCAYLLGSNTASEPEHKMNVLRSSSRVRGSGFQLKTELNQTLGQSN